MTRFLSTLVFLVLALLCIWVAVENRTLVTVKLGPVPPQEVWLFFVFFAGLSLGMIAVAFRASLSRMTARHRLGRANKKIADLEQERDALAAERDHLAAQVRPEDERLKQAQISASPAPGSLIGPSNNAQGVLPS